MKRRKQFYEKNKDSDYDKLSQEERGEIPENRVYYTVDDKISLSLEYGLGENQMPTCELASTSSNDTSSRNSHLMPSSSTENSNSNSFKSIEQEAAASRRYLLAPAGFSIKLLKKYVLCKWDLPNSKYKAQVFYLEDELDDDLNLMDIAYIYSWKRMAPLRLFYRFIPRQPKASKLNKLRASQTSSITTSSPSTSSDSHVINQQSLNNQITHQQISHQTTNHQPLLKKPKIDALQQPIPKPTTTSLNPRPQQTSIHPQSQQNRNSPSQATTVRHSPVQQTLPRASPVRLNNSSPLARCSPNSANLMNTNAKQQSMATSSTLQMLNAHLNQYQQQAKASPTNSVYISASSASNQNQNKMNLASSMKRTISKTKLNSTSQSNALDQMNGNDNEPASKYRKILPAANSAFVSNQQQQQKSFAQPVVTMPSQSHSLHTLSNYQQRKQNAALNAAKNQLNQAAQLKMANVNQLNSTLNTISNLNTLNNLSNLHTLNTLNTYRNLSASNLLNGNTPTTIASSSTVTSLRNVRVPSTEKKKNTNASPINQTSSLPKSSSQANLVANKYNLPSSTGIPPVSSANKNNTNSPPKSFNIRSILEGSNSTASKNEDKKNDLLSLNQSSLNTLNQIQNAALQEHINNIQNNLNNHLNSLPMSPTSSSHKRKSSFDRSPTNELGSSVTAKGIKIFRSGLLSPTGSNSSSSLNNSLNSMNNSLNKSNSIDKYLPIKSATGSPQSNERKSPISQPKVAVEKSSPSISSNQFKQQQQHQIKLEPHHKPEETKKPAVSATVKLNTMNSSMNSLNALNKSSSPQITTKISPTLLEAVGLSSKAASSVNSKKGASLDKIVNKIASNIIGKANSESNGNLTNGCSLNVNRNSQMTTTKNNTNTTNTQSLSFAQAVNNGLKTAAEQKSTKSDNSSSINSCTSPKPTTDSLTIKIPLLNGNLESNSNQPQQQQQPNSNRSNSPAAANSNSNSKENNSKSLFLNSKIEVTIDEDESPKQESITTKKTTSAEQVFSDVEIDVDDDDSMDGKLVMVIPPENENSSCSSSVPEDKLTTTSTTSNSSKSTNAQQTIGILKQQMQNQSLCAIQANTPPSSSPDFSKKFPSSRSNSPVSSIGDDKLKTISTTNASNKETTADQQTKPQLTAADPVSPPLTPSPRLCETQTNRENNFGALDLSTGPRKTASPIAIPTPKLTESV